MGSTTPTESSDRSEPLPCYVWQRAATLAAVAAVALYFLWRVRDALPPFLIAFFLASLLDPVVSRIQRKGVSRARAVATIYLLAFLVLVLLGYLVVPRVLVQMQELGHNMGTYSTRLQTQADSLYERFRKPLAAVGIHQNPLTTRSGPVAAAASQALDTAKGVILGLAGQVLWLVLIPLSLFYFLLDYEALRAKLLSFVSARHRDRVDQMSREVVEIFSAYARSLAIVCAIYALFAVVLFSALRLNYALFLGVAAGAFYAVPYVGPALTAVAAVTIAITMGKTMAFVIIAGVLFLVMHFTFDYGLTPRMVGGSVGLHPLTNIFALMCGATLFGIWGMLVAVPVAASLQMVLIYFMPQLAEKPRCAGEPVPEPDDDPAPSADTA